MKVALIPVARPTFDVASAERSFDQAKQLLASLGADVIAPSTLVMTPDETESVSRMEIDQEKIIYLNASFADASPAISLLGDKRGDASANDALR